MFESLYQGKKDWSLDNEIVDRRKCECGKGEIIYFERIYSSEKTLRPNKTFSSSVTKCDNCSRIKKEHKDFCTQLNEKYSNKLEKLTNSIKIANTELKKFFIERELRRIPIKTKKELLEFLEKVRLNSYGATSTFYKNTRGQDAEEILINKIDEKGFPFISILYKYSKIPIPIDVKRQLDILEDLYNEDSAIKKEIDRKVKENLVDLSRC
ncbi:hypothetical protein AZE41_12280 [Sporosarcina psychrophila]|nr:hypothetical protein AZE41_12280 [Sporosarcina psychrophila]